MLTERDMTITEWIGRQGAVRTEDTVMTRFSIGRTATYRRLHELARSRASPTTPTALSRWRLAHGNC